MRASLVRLGDARSQPQPQLLVTLACAALLSACAGDGPPPASASSGLDAIQQSIFNVSCLPAGCHNGVDRSGNLVLESGRSFGNLVNLSPANDAARAAGLLRVAPGDPRRSFLLIKLIGGTNFDPLYGSPMPKVGAHLSAAEIDLIQAWIVAGAPPASATASPTATPTASPSPTVVAPKATPTTGTPSTNRQSLQV